MATGRFGRVFEAVLRDLTFCRDEGLVPNLAALRGDLFSADLGCLARDLRLTFFDVFGCRDGIALIIPAEEVLSRGKLLE